MKRIIFLIPVLAFIIAPVIVEAQTTSNTSSSSNGTIENTLGIGPRAGYYKAAEANTGNYYFGIQSRLRFGQNWGLEGAVEYRAGQEYEIGSETFQTKFIPVTGSALFFLPMGDSFVPYGVAGIGAYYRMFESSDETSFDLSDEEFQFGYHLGFGVEFPLGKNAALNIDYRYMFLNAESNVTSTENADYSGNVATAGLMLYL